MHSFTIQELGKIKMQKQHYPTQTSVVYSQTQKRQQHQQTNKRTGKKMPTLNFTGIFLPISIFGIAVPMLMMIVSVIKVLRKYGCAEAKCEKRAPPARLPIPPKSSSSANGSIKENLTKSLPQNYASQKERQTIVIGSESKLAKLSESNSSDEKKMITAAAATANSPASIRTNAVKINQSKSGSVKNGRGKKVEKNSLELSSKRESSDTGKKAILSRKTIKSKKPKIALHKRKLSTLTKKQQQRKLNLKSGNRKKGSKKNCKILLKHEANLAAAYELVNKP